MTDSQRIEQMESLLRKVWAVMLLADAKVSDKAKIGHPREGVVFIEPTEAPQACNSTTKGKHMKSKLNVIRQGDVCLIPIASLPDGVKAVESKGRVVLAYGEVTGHAHAIYEPAKVRLWDAGAERFLQVLERCELRHEEHSPAVIEPGIYHLPQQVEYTPAELVRVTD